MKLRFLLLSFLFATSLFAQNGTVTGTILDKEFNNEPLPFANIVIKGTKQGTSTDENGQIMSMKHAHFDIRGVQYHPESVLTPYGKKILENWLSH